MICPSAADATSGTAWTRSVPTSSFALSVGYSAMSAMMINDPEPTDVMPTTMPPARPRSDGRQAPESDGRRTLGERIGASVAAPRVFNEPEVGANRESCRGEQEGDTEGDANDVLHLLAASERLCDDHAAEGAGNRPETEPLDQAEVNGASAQVDDRAYRLHQRARDEVRGDGGQRRHIEKEHEHRGHERPASHAGQPHDDTDAERGDGEQRIQVHGSSRVMEARTIASGRDRSACPTKRPTHMRRPLVKQDESRGYRRLHAGCSSDGLRHARCRRAASRTKRDAGVAHHDVPQLLLPAERGEGILPEDGAQAVGDEHIV